MRRALTLAAALILGASAAAAVQTVTVREGTVRLLDKITGAARDLTLQSGETVALGHLTLTMGECRYPANNPSGDAFIQIVVQDSREAEPLFSGWMVASAPALNAMDHPRYDVWALSCAHG